MYVYSGFSQFRRIQIYGLEVMLIIDFTTAYEQIEIYILFKIKIRV